jgi:hypothetical protein
LQQDRHDRLVLPLKMFVAGVIAFEDRGIPGATRVKNARAIVKRR